MANLQSTIINDDGFLRVSAGNNSARPSPVTGSWRFNTENSEFEYGQGSAFRGQRQDLLSSRLFQTDLVNIDDVSRSNSFREFNCLNTSPDINIGGFSSTSQRIIVPVTGVYRLYAQCHYSSGSARPAPAHTFSINGTFAPFESASSYIRSAVDHNDSSGTQEILANLNAGDEVGLGFRESSGYGGNVTLDGAQSLIHVEYLGT